MKRFITNIHVNNLYHLKDFDIKISDDAFPHLILTGKNGSGKTVLLNAISDYLEKIKDDDSLQFLKYPDNLKQARGILSSVRGNSAKTLEWEKHVRSWENDIEALSGKVSLDFYDVAYVIDKYRTGDFILAFYQATRKTALFEPTNPTKPQYNIKVKLRDRATAQFLNYLSDLKIQEALARNEGHIRDADEIATWFSSFKQILKELFEDKDLQLDFNYKDYSFHILTEGKSFKFTEVSDGFAAVLDIVMDLILKMQDVKQEPKRIYQKEGIVLIDEIETHLHLGLQKKVMPFLTRLFPGIQFIITTHSPFILSSMKDAVAFDLESRESIDNLTEYSYEALAEGYFGVRTPSSYIEMQLDTLQDLLEKKEWADTDRFRIRQLMTDFEKIPESVSPLVVGAYRQLKMKYSEKIASL